MFDTQNVRAACRCSRNKIAAMLRSFSVEERRAMIGDDGKIYSQNDGNLFVVAQ